MSIKPSNPAGRRSMLDNITAFNKHGVNPVFAMVEHQQKMREAMCAKSKVHTVNKADTLGEWLDTLLAHVLKHAKEHKFSVDTRCRGLYVPTPLTLAKNHVGQYPAAVKGNLMAVNVDLLPIPVVFGGETVVRQIGNRSVCGRIHWEGVISSGAPKYDDLLHYDVNRSFVETDVVVLSSTVRKRIETCWVISAHAEHVNMATMTTLLGGDYSVIKALIGQLESTESLAEIRVFTIQRVFDDYGDTPQTVGSVVKVWVPPMQMADDPEDFYDNGNIAYSPEQPLELTDSQLELMGFELPKPPTVEPPSEDPTNDAVLTIAPTPPTVEPPSEDPTPPTVEPPSEDPTNDAVLTIAPTTPTA